MTAVTTTATTATNPATAPATRTAAAAAAAVAYWNLNLPEADHTTTCPEFLQNLSPKDLRIISSPEAQHRPLSWADAQAIVATNDLARFDRPPLSLRRYLGFLWDLRRRHGSVAAFLLAERLRWPGPLPVRPRGAPFEHERDDVCVLQNDWPYGMDPRIVHLVVWTKFRLPGGDGDGDDGDGDDGAALSPETHTLIDGYVDRKFRAHMPPCTVIWFKNWGALKSVDSIEHFHVLMFDPDPAFVHEVTGGVVPLYLQPSSS